MVEHFRDIMNMTLRKHMKLEAEKIKKQRENFRLFVGEERWETMQNSCTQHGGFKGKSYPSHTDCMRCWELYFQNNMNNPITGKVMLDFMKAISDLCERSEKNAVEAIVERLTYDPDCY